MQIFIIKFNHPQATITPSALKTSPGLSCDLGGRRQGHSCMKSDYYNYFIMMNYYAVATNVGSAPQQPPLNYALASQVQIPLLLKAISMALTNSLKNYQDALLASSPSSQSQPNPQNTPPAPEAPQLASSPPAQITPQIQVTISAPGPKLPPPTHSNPLRNTEVKPSPILHLSTSDEHPEDRPERTTVIREERYRKKSCTEGKSEEKVGTKSPLVDLIDSAYLPSLGMQRAQLERIRVQLQLRQVEEWNEKARCRWEKRELRLLGC